MKTIQFNNLEDFLKDMNNKCSCLKEATHLRVISNYVKDLTNENKKLRQQIEYTHEGLKKKRESFDRDLAEEVGRIRSRLLAVIGEKEALVTSLQQTNEELHAELESTKQKLAEVVTRQESLTALQQTNEALRAELESTKQKLGQMEKQERLRNETQSTAMTAKLQALERETKSIKDERDAIVDQLNRFGKGMGMQNPEYKNVLTSMERLVVDVLNQRTTNKKAKPSTPIRDPIQRLQKQTKDQEACWDLREQWGINTEETNEPCTSLVQSFDAMNKDLIAALDQLKHAISNQETKTMS